jgi:uncharacterized damage-inducible protein DinB
MDLFSTIRRLFAHNDWANRETLRAMQRAGDVPRARKVFAHILAAERLWLERLKQEPRKFAVWPDFTLADCETQLAALQSAWRDYCEQLTPAALDSRAAYANSKGERWENTVGDVLLHLAMHSSYHRGQIAIALRDAGAEPAYTDYIEAVRRGRLES